MKRKIVALLLSATLAAMVFVGCGAEKKETKKTVDITEETGKHDASEKENSYAKDFDMAKEQGKGSTDILSGTYSAEKLENTQYVFNEDTMMIVEKGTYEITTKEITMQYGNGEKTTYSINETDAGFNLLAGESTLLPLVYMEGTDGLTGADAFDGVYAIENAQGFLFHKDGTLNVITKQECSVEENTVTFGNATYNWESNDGKIELSSNGTKVLTLIP